MAFVLRVFHIAYLSLLLVVNKTSLFFPDTHVRMAERSKAPDSRVELFLTGVFWSTNVGVGSNPTSDKRFRVTRILKISHTLLLQIILWMTSGTKKTV